MKPAEEARWATRLRGRKKEASEAKLHGEVVEEKARVLCALVVTRPSNHPRRRQACYQRMRSCRSRRCPVKRAAEQLDSVGTVTVIVLTYVDVGDVLHGLHTVVPKEHNGQMRTSGAFAGYASDEDFQVAVMLMRKIYVKLSSATRFGGFPCCRKVVCELSEDGEV